MLSINTIIVTIIAVIVVFIILLNISHCIRFVYASNFISINYYLAGDINIMITAIIVTIGIVVISIVIIIAIIFVTTLPYPTVVRVSGYAQRTKGNSLYLATLIKIYCCVILT